jgi:CRP/FNR family transcriptional regulator
MNIREIFSNLSTDLIDEIISVSTEKEIPENTVVVREGQYVNSVPIVVKGLVKVFTRNEDKELLLYYIKPAESCIMTFDAGLKNAPSKVYASTEEMSSVLLLPIEKITGWMKKYPEMNSLFFQQYNIRYSELIFMINQLLFEKMDNRLLSYLKNKISVSHSKNIKMSHQQIANDLGTAREVVSRILKKLENENKIIQNENGITIL